MEDYKEFKKMMKKDREGALYTYCHSKQIEINHDNQMRVLYLILEELKKLNKK